VSHAGRSEARERALSLLYEAEMKHLDPLEVLEGLPVPPDPYCAELIRLVSEHQDEARRQIQEASANWPLERMGVIDRLVMELAIAELQGSDPPPRAVVLDEAVELAKTFSTESSGSFVNGVLSAVTEPTT
jgi:N utilization substance protein B